MAYEGRRQQHIATLFERFPPAVERLTWDSRRLAAYRLERLRELVAHAVAHSPFHRERLAGLDPQTMTEDDLARVPIMTKRDLVDHFDAIVTDPRLNRSVVEAHVDFLDGGPAYLFDEYHVVATGGSSGERTVVVWDWEGWADCFVSMSRHSLARSTGSTRQPVVATVAGGHPSHMSSAAQATFHNPAIQMHQIAASLPIEQIVAQLDAVQPETIIGYASMIHRVALEAEAGRLTIGPDKVLSSSEALLPETRELVGRVWDVIVDNSYAASETGAIGASCGTGPWMHLADDLHAIEIEEQRVVVTNLINRVLPLIRYELDDRTKLLDLQCPCGSGHRTIGDVEGRADDTFTFSDGTRVHPFVFASVIGKYRGVAEYQVGQHGDEISVDLLKQNHIDLVSLRGEIESALHRAGAIQAKVSTRLVDAIERHGATGKLRRFLPDR